MSSRTRAFTLVEVLVASTIGVFIALVAVGALRTVSASSEVLDQNVGAAAQVRFAANMIARDLANFYHDDQTDNMRFIGTVEELSGDRSTSHLIFYTVNRTKARVDQPEGDVYEVEYFLTEDEDRSLLMRRLWPYPNKELEPGGVLTVIAEDIGAFEVQYFDGEEWSAEWPEEMGSLPGLVAITIAAKQSGKGQPQTESLIVPMTRAAGGTTALDTETQIESGM
jgi:type II secretion system protein J